MAETYNNPIDLIRGFKRLGSYPLDDSTVVDTYADLNNIEYKYEGLIVYVENTQTHYWYDGTIWNIFGGSGLPGGVHGSIQVKGVGDTFEGWNDFLWDNVAKKMQVSQFSLKSVDNTIEFYDDIDSHYATLIGSGSPVEKALDFIDPLRFDILVHNTVLNGLATFTLQPNRADALSFISGSDRLMQFKTSTGDLKVEMHQTLNLQDVVDGDDTMEALVLDPVTMDVKKFPITGVTDSTIDINQTGIGLLASVNDLIASLDGAYVLANAINETKVAKGFVVEIVDDDNIKIQDSGTITYTAAVLTVGDVYLLGTTDGSITAIEPDDYIQIVGWAVDTDKLRITIEPMFYFNSSDIEGIFDTTFDYTFN